MEKPQKLKNYKYNRKWVLVGFLIAIGSAVIWNNALLGILSILLFQLALHIDLKIALLEG